MGRKPYGGKNFLKLFSSNTIKWKVILSKSKGREKVLSIYRKRLIDRGIIISEHRGEMSLSLPRFSEYIHSLEN